MRGLSLSEIAAAIGAHRVGDADPVVQGVSTDTRSLAAGELFVALKGERFDAHDFIRRGALPACAVLVEREVDTELPQLRVDDTLVALGRLAAFWRGRMPARVVALTGSSGKTTVKEMIASILELAGPTLATRGNLNNEIGVPLTLLSIEPAHAFAVIEMGASHAGEIAYLTALARPDVALVNNAGAAHLEGFGSLDGVAHAKGEIYAGLGDDGVAVINADDRYADLWRGMSEGRKQLGFGLDAQCDCRGIWRAGAPLTIGLPNGAVIQVDLPLAGRHNALNALAAAAAAAALDIKPALIHQGLERVRPVPGRLHAMTGRHGLRLIDDSYNANPTSTAAAIEVLAAMPAPRVLVLGDMLELGEAAAALHRETGRHAAAAGIGRLYACGDMTRHAVEGFGTGGRHFDDQAALIEALKADLDGRESVLVKGSRGMRMERVVQALAVDAAAEVQAHAG